MYVGEVVGADSGRVGDAGLDDVVGRGDCALSERLDVGKAGQRRLQPGKRTLDFAQGRDLRLDRCFLSLERGGGQLKGGARLLDQRGDLARTQEGGYRHGSDPLRLRESPPSANSEGGPRRRAKRRLRRYYCNSFNSDCCRTLDCDKAEMPACCRISCCVSCVVTCGMLASCTTPRAAVRLV